MSWPWAVPFFGVLLSIAAGPLLFPTIWHRHYGKIAGGWAVLTLAALWIYFGAAATRAAFVHAVFADYLSFILLLFALYTVAGGILLEGGIRATPWANTAMLALGTAMASVIGTTGAAMVLIRPLIRANSFRPHKTHVVIFFIILVANVGGALTPLGDPPLFIGFLRGVDFFWTAQHLWRQTLIVAALVLGVFFAVDLWRARHEPAACEPAVAAPIRIRGLINLLLIAVIIAAILLSAVWKPGIGFEFNGTRFELQNLLRDGAMILTALASLWLTADEHRAANGFDWGPMKEVAILFAAIFIAIIPVIAMLEAGHDGAFAYILRAVTTPGGRPNDAAYFWLTGGLSAFLDNAPTYLVFFELAGGDAGQLMGPHAGTLASISMGAVYMGALTYLGNAPNLMVYAIAKDNGIAMPNFFGYVAWATLILVPLFVLLTLLPMAPLLTLG
ncbi:MAG TPA: sodium:proton antiporter [Xanthobacteraceae bacterium]|nr:sodium:proton antiporter [Xanthobacteraceae bacterium]